MSHWFLTTGWALTCWALSQGTRCAAAVNRGFEGEAEGGFRQSWHTHLGMVELRGVRQRSPDLALRWQSAIVSAPAPPGSVTFAWTGALGMGRGDGGNFTVWVNGRAAADFDVAIEPTRFLARADGCDLLYDAVWTYADSHDTDGNALDSSGHFFLTVPAEWVRPGERAVLEVKARDVGQGRWFGLVRTAEIPATVPERSWTRFVRRQRPAMPPRAGEEAGYTWYLEQYADPGLYTPIGPPADPAEVAVSRTGQLMYANELTHRRGGIPGTHYVRHALAFAFAEDGRITPAGARGAVRQSLLEDRLPIIVTAWEGRGEIEVKETAFAEPLRGQTYESGLEQTLAWAAFDLHNHSARPRPVTFLAFHTADEKEPRPPMEGRGSVVLANGSALFCAQAPANFSTEFFPVFPAMSALPESKDLLGLLRAGRAVANALVVRGTLPPNGSVRIVVNRVFDFPGAMHWNAKPPPPVRPEDLLGRSFDAGLARMQEVWRQLAGPISRFRTPDPVLNRIYQKAMLDGYFLTKRWNGRWIVFDSVSYRCQWDDASTKWFYALDLLGDHTTAERLLDTVFARQGQRKPAGTRTREGCFSDVTNIERDGSDAAWASCNGWALWAMAEHARLTGHRPWLDQHKPQILAGCRWILRERAFSTASPTNPCAGLLFGKFVCDMPNNGAVSGVGYFAYTDAISYLGLQSTARLLADQGHAEGKELLQEAEAYRQDIVAAVDRLTDRAQDPWYVPWMLHVPRHQARYFYDVCGPINLAYGGVVPREDERIAQVIGWIVDRTHHGSLEAAAAGVDQPDEGAMFYSQDLAITLLELGRVEDFLRIFYTLLAANISHETLTTCEWMGNTQPHVHSIASLIRMLRTLLVQERDGALFLLQGTPRRWLEDGEELHLREAPTWYGPLSLRCTSRLKEGRVDLTLNAPQKLGAVPVRLRLRLPNGFHLQSARVGDTPVEVQGEWLLLQHLSGEARLRAVTRPSP